jgi:hypothetical protein
MAISFPQAARRCWHDAELLCESNRFGTPDHLFGLAAECALKSVLGGLGAFPANTTPPKPYRIHVDTLWSEYNLYVRGPAGRAGLLAPGIPFAAWSASDRYLDDESFSASRLETHRNGALLALKLYEAALLDGLVM